MPIRDDIMDNLLVALRPIWSSDNYEAQLAEPPMIYQVDYANRRKDQTPILMAVDQGNDTVITQTSTETGYIFDVIFYGYVSEFDWGDAQEKLNAIISSVKQRINESPDLGSSVKEWQFVELGGHTQEPGQARYHTTIVTRIIYKVTNGVY